MPKFAMSVSGVQGSGKTTLARAIAEAFDAVLISRDPLMSALVEAGLPAQGDAEHAIPNVRRLGHVVQTTLLVELLGTGRSVILECVADPATRDVWRDVAEAAGAPFFFVETVCSDQVVHRQRFTERGDRSLGAWELTPGDGTWEAVERNMLGYVRHPNAHAVIDAVNPLRKNVEQIARLLNGDLPLQAAPASTA